MSKIRVRRKRAYSYCVGTPYLKCTEGSQITKSTPVYIIDYLKTDLQSFNRSMKNQCNCRCHNYVCSACVKNVTHPNTPVTLLSEELLKD